MSFSANYPTIAPSILLDFANSNAVDPRVTFTRASTGSYFDSAGVLQSAAINAPRLDYNPSTLAAQGLLIEEQRTNSIRNNTMVGAVAGTPGTNPTNWSSAWVSLIQGLQYSVAGVGTESGIAYIDINVSGTFSGTPGATSATPAIETGLVIAAVAGQLWTQSLYIKLVSGSLSGVEVSQRINEINSGGTTVTSGTSVAISVTSGSLSTGRTTFTRTITDATTAFIQPAFRFVYSALATYNFTLRIGLPQLELGAFATSVIPTSTAAVTRSADVASVNTLSPWFNATSGTIYSEFQSIGQTTTAKIVLFDNGAGFADSLDQYLSSGAPRFEVYVSSSTQASLTPAGGAISLNTTTKFSSAYAANDFAAARNGGTVLTDASGTVPTVSRLLLGNTTLSTQFLNGYIRRIAYYPIRLSNANLQALTS